MLQPLPPVMVTSGAEVASVPASGSGIGVPKLTCHSEASAGAGADLTIEEPWQHAEIGAVVAHCGFGVVPISPQYPAQHVGNLGGLSPP
jgi:hypothetical protein